MNKTKIINDPVYGFVSIPSPLIFDLIAHPFFQRLRFINQLGISGLVYPGAVHTRFHHALGAMHLMKRALESLRNKKIEISDQEMEAAQVAILLHDIGHGPLSHSLEETLLPGIKHESISYLFMKSLNDQFGGKLDLALRIFRNSYGRKFFHQLISSQLDVDRLDYLNRDSFFTGVAEGTVSVDRIIEMLHVHRDQLVVEEKGIFSIENFLHARRLMYWQVYLHKTVVSAERMIVNIVKRAQYLVAAGEQIPGSEALLLFLTGKYSSLDLSQQPKLLHAFGRLDDNDLWGALKLWSTHPDEILSDLCQRVLHRHIFQIELSLSPVKRAKIEAVKKSIQSKFKLLKKDTGYYFSHGSVTNEAYLSNAQPINILMKSGRILDIAHASDLPTIQAMSKIVKKNYLCWPKNLPLPNLD
ncbi:MAG: HD domain-containing protein [Bacteroidetes bacterium]|nr:HD domain-containing protein [Bacteroidota bacterium]MBS1541055.1 HD domain-containing protein [Bacteroidota bacterium]